MSLRKYNKPNAIQKIENRKLVRICPQCNSFSEHASNCTLKTDTSITMDFIPYGYANLMKKYTNDTEIQIGKLLFAEGIALAYKKLNVSS